MLASRVSLVREAVGWEFGLALIIEVQVAFQLVRLSSE